LVVCTVGNVKQLFFLNQFLVGGCAVLAARTRRLKRLKLIKK